MRSWIEFFLRTIGMAGHVVMEAEFCVMASSSLRLCFTETGSFRVCVLLAHRGIGVKLLLALQCEPSRGRAMLDEWLTDRTMATHLAKP